MNKTELLKEIELQKKTIYTKSCDLSNNTREKKDIEDQIRSLSKLLSNKVDEEKTLLHESVVEMRRLGDLQYMLDSHTYDPV